jgi:hypothetical protein
MQGNQVPVGKKIIVYLLIMSLVVGASLYFKNKSNQFTEGVACTMEAKICDDGSAVGRTGPNCEFAACPAPVVDNSASTTKSVFDKNAGLNFEYIDNFYKTENEETKLTEYIHPVEWPPQVEVKTEKFTCADALKNVNGSKYCVVVLSEGAAGSTYTTYTYKKQVLDNKVNKTLAFTFITRVPQCMNFDEPNQTNCKNEIKNFSLDNLIDKVFNSVKFVQATTTKAVN